MDYGRSRLNFVHLIMLFAIIIMYMRIAASPLMYSRSQTHFPLRFKFSLAELGLGTRLPFDLRPCLTLYTYICQIVQLSLAILGIHGHQYLALYRALVMEIDNKCPLTTDRDRGRFCGRIPRNVRWLAV